MNLLEIKNITVKYEEKIVLDTCNLNVSEGEIVAILGASGDGKTTLLKAISGFLPIHKGVIAFKSKRILDSTEQLIPGHDSIKLINQDFNLDLFHTVEENIKLKLLKYNEEYVSEKIEELMELTGLTDEREMRSNELSGGQKQRLAIARALADDPDLILLDEPFNQLDFQMKSRIGKYIRAYLHENNISAILVTHNGVEAMDWADKIVFLKDGKVLREDNPVDFFTNPSNENEARFFGDLNKLVVDGNVHYFRPGNFSLQMDDNFVLGLKVKFIKRKILGWYSEFVFVYENQQFSLFSSASLEDIEHVFIQPIKFID